MRVLICGAHFTPAVAVIEELKKSPNIKITYVGRSKTMEADSTKSAESQILPSLGVKFISLTTGRLQRSFSIYTLFSLVKIPIGFIQAFFIILSERPNVILSFGGYISVPLVIMGWLFSIPVISHEQTLIPGLANKISRLLASKVALSFKPDFELGDKYLLTGNPIRSGIIDTKKLTSLEEDLQKVFKISSSEKLPVILVMGGNQGSHVLNLTVENILEKITKIALVIHVSGTNKYKDFERLNGYDFSNRYKVLKWLGKDYGTVLQKVDLVICRAGINTLTELALLGKPALVVPIPYLYQDEQNVNAKFFKHRGLVEILPQNKLSGEILLTRVKNILKDLNNFNKRAKEARKTIILNGAKRLALETMILGENA